MDTNLSNRDIQFKYWPTLLPRNASDVANPSIKWRFGSRFVVPVVGLFSKLWMNVVNTSVVHNADILYEALNQNYRSSSHHGSSLSLVRCQTHDSPGRPLITYSNHTSCLDDPLIWGALIPFKWQFNSDRHRWSAAASEICFTKKWHSFFFSFGKTFPIIRGEGIYQPAMDYAYKLMKSGQWLHFFPQGKVIPRPQYSDPQLLKFKFDENGQPINDNRRLDQCDQPNENYTLKWGMARLIIEYVLGEGKQQDAEYKKFKGEDCFDNSLDTSNQARCDINFDSDQSNTLPEVDVLPIYHLGMDEVLPTKHPYVPRMFTRVTFLVRPEGPIRIDRQFLLRLFSQDEPASGNGCTSMVRSAKEFELSLSEKRIRLMKFFEQELDKLAKKAHFIHEHFNN